MTSVELHRAEAERLHTAGRWGTLFAAVWLLYLLTPLQEGWSRRDSVRGWVGILLTVAFAVGYLAVFVHFRRRRAPGTVFRVSASPAARWSVLGGLAVIAVLDCLALGQSATATSVYLAVVAVICLPSPQAWLVAGTTALVTYLASLAVPGWEEDRNIFFGVLVATLAIWGISQAINRNIEVLQIREDNARLALAEERNRFARDLHDILGHSLTVITVKAELATRLVDVDPARARAELEDLERLSRDALADVRRTVEGYREITLPGELARARAALAAAEIEADLPNTTDDVPGERRELFAWTVREGITNVLRHSGATRCSVRLRQDAVEVRDDGAGPSAPSTSGHGLVGLRERAEAVGGVVTTQVLDPGFLLRVEVP